MLNKITILLLILLPLSVSSQQFGIEVQPRGIGNTQIGSTLIANDTTNPGSIAQQFSASYYQLGGNTVLYDTAYIPIVLYFIHDTATGLLFINLYWYGNAAPALYQSAWIPQLFNDKSFYVDTVLQKVSGHINNAYLRNVFIATDTISISLFFKNVSYL